MKLFILWVESMFLRALMHLWMFIASLCVRPRPFEKWPPLPAHNNEAEAPKVSRPENQPSILRRVCAYSTFPPRNPTGTPLQEVSTIPDTRDKYRGNNKHWWVVSVEPTHLKKYESNGKSSPNIVVKIKNSWNHHLVYDEWICVCVYTACTWVTKKKHLTFHEILIV